MKWTIVRNANDYAHKKYSLVAVTAMIRDNSTGEIVEYATEEPLYDYEDQPSDFNWSDNNYSCDCNRKIFFNRTKGVDCYDDSPCTDGNFSVNLKNTLTGKTYYKEF